MAGGKGTRLWPMSRDSKPKQLQSIIGSKTMIQETFARLNKAFDIQNIYISTNYSFLEAIKEQLPQIPESNYIIEPISRNTGPAIGLIAAKIIHNNPNAIITTIASDHVVTKIDNYLTAIKACQFMVNKDSNLVGTIGIQPTSPQTGFGYIKQGNQINEINGVKIYSVEQFVEKPDQETAQKYLDSKQYFWNASYFTFSAKKILDVLREHQPQVRNHLLKIQKTLGTDLENETIKQEFLKMPEIAIDYLLEELGTVFVAATDLGWDDVGNWESIKNIISSTTNEDVIERGNHIGIDNKNCLIYAQDRLIATIGLNDLIVVDTDDAILICDKNKTQDVKKITEMLKYNPELRSYL
jgi:mannose-1-phosphate guanylyltransferase